MCSFPKPPSAYFVKLSLLPLKVPGWRTEFTHAVSFAHPGYRCSTFTLSGSSFMVSLCTHFLRPSVDSRRAEPRHSACTLDDDMGNGMSGAGAPITKGFMEAFSSPRNVQSCCMRGDSYPVLVSSHARLPSHRNRRRPKFHCTLGRYKLETFNVDGGDQVAASQMMNSSGSHGGGGARARVSSTLCSALSEVLPLKISDLHSRLSSLFPSNKPLFSAAR